MTGRSLEALHREAEAHLDDASIWLELALALAGAAIRHRDSLDRAAALAALRHVASLTADAELIGEVAAAFADLDELDESCAELARLEGGPPRASHLLAVARRLLDADRAADALALLQPAAAVVEGDDTLRLLRALALAGTGALDRALDEVQATIARSPELADAHLVKAQLLAGQNRGDECILAWEAAARLQPDDPRAATGLGVALAAAGRHDEAVDLLFHVVRTNQGSSEAYQNLAIVLREARRLEEAEWAARQAVELAPEAAQPHYDLGLVLEAASRFEDAAEAFGDAAARAGAWSKPGLALARVLDRIGRTAEAVETLGRAAALQPADSREAREIADALAALRGRGSSGQGALAGDLAAFSIWQILEILQNHRWIGRLELTFTSGHADIFVREGTIARIVSAAMEPLAEVLRALPDVDRPRITKAVADLKGQSDYKVALRVRRLDLISGARLREAVETQLRQALERLIDRTDGTFAFHKGEFERAGTDLSIDIRFVLLEIARLRDAAAPAG